MTARPKIIVSIALAITSAACVKKQVLTQGGSGVRLLVKSEPDANCKELGEVSTGNDWFKSEEDVKIRLRNRAAETGANVATLDVLKQDGALVGGSGRSFKCP